MKIKVNGEVVNLEKSLNINDFLVRSRRSSRNMSQFRKTANLSNVMILTRLLLRKATRSNFCTLVNSKNAS